MQCAVTHDLNQHLANVEDQEAEAEWIESQKSGLFEQYRQYSLQQIESDLETEYGIYLEEFAEVAASEGCFKAIDMAIDSIDWCSELEKYKSESKLNNELKAID